MRTLELLTTVALLTAAGTARAQMPHTFGPGTAARAPEVNENFAFLAAKPRVFATRACTSSDCLVPATTADRNNRGNHWITLASLPLPKGNWLVSAKLTTWSPGGYGFVLDCSVEDGASHFDQASCAYGGSAALHLELPLSMQIPVTFELPGTMTLKCRAVGESVTTPGNLVTMYVWQAAITAVEVASITWP